MQVSRRNNNSNVTNIAGKSSSSSTNGRKKNNSSAVKAVPLSIQRRNAFILDGRPLDKVKDFRFRESKFKMKIFDPLEEVDRKYQFAPPDFKHWVKLRDQEAERLRLLHEVSQERLRLGIESYNRMVYDSCEDELNIEIAPPKLQPSSVRRNSKLVKLMEASLDTTLAMSMNTASLSSSCSVISPPKADRPRSTTLNQACDHDASIDNNMKQRLLHKNVVWGYMTRPVPSSFS